MSQILVLHNRARSILKSPMMAQWSNRKCLAEESSTIKEVEANLYLINDPSDVLILVAALKAKVNYLVMHNRKHFLDDPKVAERSGLKIGTPGDVLAWLRDNL